MQALDLLKPAETALGERNRALFAVWQHAAAGRAAPRREDITMKMLRHLTQWMWLAEVLDDGLDFRFRLVGDGLVQFFGVNHTGEHIGSLHGNPFFRNVSAALHHCRQQAMPFVYGPTPSRYVGKEHWEYEFLLLPLSQDGNCISCLIGTMDVWPLGTYHGQDTQPAPVPSVCEPQ